MCDEETEILTVKSFLLKDIYSYQENEKKYFLIFNFEENRLKRRFIIEIYFKYFNIWFRFFLFLFNFNFYKNFNTLKYNILYFFI